MIVKDEAPVIRRCLESLIPFIHSWLIVDTGSKDGTMKIIKQSIGHLPGKLVSRPWVDFGSNRSEALRFARSMADYSLVMDADDVLLPEPGFELPELDAPYYFFSLNDNGQNYLRIQLVDNRYAWYYKGVLHEYITCDAISRYPPHPISGIGIQSTREGNRSCNPFKYQKDAEILESALIDEPGNRRYMFYLAQSYRDFDDYSNAIDRYEKRIAMGGEIEEIYYSRYEIGRQKQLRGDPWQEVLASFIDAQRISSHRAEPLFEIAVVYRLQGNWPLAYRAAKQGTGIPLPKNDRLYVTPAVYQWQLFNELAIAAYWVGEYQESLALNRQLLANPAVPDEFKPQIQENLQFALNRCVEADSHPS